MGKRQRKVFKSHAEVTHVWAQQRQEQGVAGNIFFRDTTKLYSYGYHYLMAQVHEVKGKKFALVNSRVYSNSTAKHLSYTRSALRGLMPYFEVPDASSLSNAVKDLDDAVLRSTKHGLSRKYFSNEGGTGINQALSYLDLVHSAYAEATKLREFLGRKPGKFPQKEYDTLKAHLDKLAQKWASPERAKARAAKAKEGAEKEAKRRAENAKQTAEELAKFRAGSEYSGWKMDTEFDLLRIRGSRVETSRGAIVPLEEARKLLARVQAGEAVNGVEIGEYTVNGVDCTDEACTDKIVSIGCHRILLSEAVNVLAKPAHLSLVGAS